MHTLSSGKKEAWLSWFLRGLLILLFLILLAKLFEVQIIKGNYYKKLSQENRIRHVMFPAPRGKILAKGGEEIAGNVEIKKSINFTSQSGFTLSDDLTNAGPDQIVTDYKRIYPMGNKFSQALGYVSQVGTDEIGKIDPNCPEKGPRISDSLIGKTGLEEEYNCWLSGTQGEELIEVDASGKQVRILGRRAAVPGRDLKTTIDYGLQTELSVAMGEMKGVSGAAIVTDPEGQILAFYSYPSFDPNIFVSKGNSDEISSLLNNANLPFYNRVISGTFHPGSVFKPVVAIAALEQGVIDKNFTYNDQGIITVNNFSYRNWYFTQYGRTEGSVDLVKALARSTDTFFYTIGQMMGPDVLAKWAKTFGLDSPTGIDIPNETQGLIPTPEWKEKTIKESWYLGNTYNMSIGQGDVSVTPIEINTLVSAISAGGKLCKPRFNMEMPVSCKTISVSQKNLDLVKTGMEAACTTGGTAYTFFDFKEKHNDLTVACKTGTAEVGTDGMPHAWFTFFAPAENPKIVATVLVEKGGEGSSIAGPIARKIADYYFASQ
jgi:penicillin-binding protein 2